MGYNRSLDLMAIATAAVKAGLPEKAADYLRAAAKDPSADKAIAAVFAANAKKKTPAKKKKAKASFTAEQLILRAAFNVTAGDDEVEEDKEEDKEEDETVEEAESDEDVMKVEDDEAVAALRAALVEGGKEVTTDELEDMTREEETASDEEETEKFLPVSAKKATAKASNERFARTLRNLAARSK